jgi:hypothetical protein
LFVWLVVSGWCSFVLRKNYRWLVAGGRFILREKCCCLVVDKADKQSGPRFHLHVTTFQTLFLQEALHILSQQPNYKKVLRKELNYNKALQLNLPEGSYEDAGVGEVQFAGGGLQGRRVCLHPDEEVVQSVSLSRDECACRSHAHRQPTGVVGVVAGG